MISNTPNPKVDFYFTKAKKWQHELLKLRVMVLDCGLTEELKWGCPCYALAGTNIVLIHVFKEYCALLFFKGALLNNDSGMLIQQTENVQAARQIRFTGIEQIVRQEVRVIAYIHEAIAVEKAGLKVVMKTASEFKVAEEFQYQLDENPALKTAFEALTPGRQKGYHIYFCMPKQAKTREARVEKAIPKIMEGKGLEDE